MCRLLRSNHCNMIPNRNKFFLDINSPCPPERTNDRTIETLLCVWTARLTLPYDGCAVGSLKKWRNTNGNLVSMGGKGDGSFQSSYQFPRDNRQKSSDASDHIPIRFRTSRGCVSPYAYECVLRARCRIEPNYNARWHTFVPISNPHHLSLSLSFVSLFFLHLLPDPLVCRCLSSSS